jgi:biopolymer transport protein ExbD
MAGGSSETDDGINGINVTPLVDIALVLLIIFMVTARIISQSSSIPLDLPKSVTGADNQVQTVFSVVLAADGSTQVDSKPVANDDAILALAKAAASQNKDLRAVIKADNTVSHGRVIHVLDMLKQAQLSKIAFGVSKLPGGTSSAPAPKLPAPQ